MRKRHHDDYFDVLNRVSLGHFFVCEFFSAARLAFSTLVTSIIYTALTLEMDDGPVT